MVALGAPGARRSVNRRLYWGYVEGMRNWMKGIVVGALVFLAITAAFLAGYLARGASASGADGASVASLRSGIEALTGASTRPAGDLGVFWEAWGIVRREFYGQVPDETALSRGALRGALTTLNDPNTVYIEPRAAEKERNDLAGQFEGIGANVSSNEKGQLVIVNPLPDQPADKAGLKAGDIVLKVDGRDIAGLSVDDAVALIRGPKGSKVVLTIGRGEATPFDVTVTRDAIATPSVTWRMLDDLGAPTTGYARISLFSDRAPRELEWAIQELKQKGATSLILDLRGNPGGYLNAAIAVASQFIPDGIIAYERRSDGTEESFPAKGSADSDLPLVVLVNGGSASASEIVAGAIRDRQRGTLVGVKTFGKGSVQNVHQLSDGSTLHVTIAHWLTPNRQDISKAGIEPDIVVEGGDPNGDKGDAQLQRAIDAARRAH
ncbi:MAG: S41 family peptidase [Anaerolineae bacterium]